VLFVLFPYSISESIYIAAVRVRRGVWRVSLTQTTASRSQGDLITLCGAAACCAPRGRPHTLTLTATLTHISTHSHAISLISWRPWRCARAILQFHPSLRIIASADEGARRCCLCSHTERSCNFQFQPSLCIIASADEGVRRCCLCSHTSISPPINLLLPPHFRTPAISPKVRSSTEPGDTTPATPHTWPRSVPAWRHVSPGDTARSRSPPLLPCCARYTYAQRPSPAIQHRRARGLSAGNPSKQ
jgi:hypothetical protein